MADGLCCGLIPFGKALVRLEGFELFLCMIGQVDLKQG